jgi:DNA-binding GntR family transcriptional regulator
MIVLTRNTRRCMVYTRNRRMVNETMEEIGDLASELDVSNLSDRVYNHIKRLIMTGILKGGQRIPEQVIAEKFKVSRTPIREALRRLEEHGLVVIKPRRSTRVATVTPDDKKHIGEVRIQLSVLSVRLLAHRVTPKDCTVLRELAAKCQDYAEKGDSASCFEVDSLLHCEIAERSGHQYLADLTRILDHKVQLLRNIEEVSQEQLKERISLHIPIVEAICRHDAQAAEKMMFDHLSAYYFAPDSPEKSPSKIPPA